MTGRPFFIEPLRDSLLSLIRHGQRSPISQATTLYGSESDLSALVQSISQIRTVQPHDLLVVDLTPFRSLGTPTRLLSIEDIYQTVPFVVAVKSDVVLEQLRVLSRVSVVICDEHNRVKSLNCSGEWGETLGEACRTYLPVGTSITDAHSEWVERSLLLIAEQCVRRPPEGTRYPLHDGAWANQWIDVKAILCDPDVAFFIAYQMGYVLTKGYNESLAEEGILASNNTAYVLASLLQSIFDDKDLVMIDHLGPYPSLAKLRVQNLESLKMKSYCMVEDVMSTGRELDLTHLTLFFHQADVARAVCLFDLEVALSQLIPPDKVLSLCRPSQSLEYERSPRHAHSKEAL